MLKPASEGTHRRAGPIGDDGDDIGDEHAGDFTPIGLDLIPGSTEFGVYIG